MIIGTLSYNTKAVPFLGALSLNLGQILIKDGLLGSDLCWEQDVCIAFHGPNDRNILYEADFLLELRPDPAMMRNDVGAGKLCWLVAERIEEILQGVYEQTQPDFFGFRIVLYYGGSEFASHLAKMVPELAKAH